MSGDIHALSGAYAIDAVDNFERAQFERHLSGCVDCRLEVESLREGTALLAEVVAQHRGGSRAEVRGRVLDLLRLVGIQNAEVVARRYPFQLSGGMAQRVCIALALAGKALHAHS